jgi:hypothetical protein
MPLEELSLTALRARALRLGWIARHSRTCNQVAGDDSFVVLNRYRNPVATDRLDEAGLREWLIDTLRERRRAFYW